MRKIWIGVLLVLFFMSPKGVVVQARKQDAKAGVHFTMPLPVYQDSVSRIKYYNEIPEIEFDGWDRKEGIAQSCVEFRFRKKTYRKEKNFVGKEKITYNIHQIHSLLVKGCETSCKDNPIYVSGSLTNHAGNPIQENLGYAIVIDRDAPNISVNRGKKKYFKDTATFQVTVEDWNFREDAVRWDIQGNRNGYQIDKWEGSGKKHWCEVRFERNGTYQIGLTVSDYAGNQKQYMNPKKIIIDKTSPEILLWKKPGKGDAQKYYNHAPDIYVMVRDEQIDRDGVHLVSHTKNHATQELTLQKVQGEVPYEICKYLLEERWQVYRCTLSQEGYYQLSGYCVDRAGNVSDTRELPPVIFDQTAPKITYQNIDQNIKEKKTFTDVVNPKIIVEDEYLDAKACKLEVFYADGTKVISLEKKMERSGDEEGSKKVSFWWKDFPREKKYDNYYILKLTAVDLIGNQNKTEHEISFYVNRYGTRYELTEETAQYIEKQIHNQEADISIIAYSLHPIQTQIYVSYEKEEAVLLKQENYQEKTIRISKKQSKKENAILPKHYSGWYQTTYRIHQSVFGQQGNYQLFLQSSELGKNNTVITKSENTSWTKKPEFIIDKTPPVVLIGGLDQEYYIAKQVTYTITAMDNTKIKRVRMYLKKEGSNEKRYITDYGEEDFNENHRREDVLQAMAGYQILGYEARDIAGNVISAEELHAERRILISENQIMSVYYRYQKQIAVAILLIIIAICCVIVLTKKKFFDIVKKRQ